jgi:hypothetical protein
MSLDDVKTAIAAMPQQDRGQLVAYLVHLRHQRDPSVGAELRARLADTDRANWLSLDELRERWKWKG